MDLQGLAVVLEVLKIYTQQRELTVRNHLMSRRVSQVEIDVGCINQLRIDIREGV